MKNIYFSIIEYDARPMRLDVYFQTIGLDYYYTKILNKYLISKAIGIRK